MTGLLISFFLFSRFLAAKEMKDKLALDLPRQGSGTEIARDSQPNMKNTSAQSASSRVNAASKAATAKGPAPGRSVEGNTEGGDDAGGSPAKVSPLAE